MKDAVYTIKDKLEAEIKDLPNHGMTPDTLEMAQELGETWMLYKGICDKMHAPAAMLTREDAEAWAAGLINNDGPTSDTRTHGPHWDITTTTAVASEEGVYFTHITDWMWWITLNMMYSDYCNTAKTFGTTSPSFFASLAKEFLFDPDGPGPEKKLGAYYHGIVCAGKH